MSEHHPRLSGGPRGYGVQWYFGEPFARIGFLFSLSPTNETTGDAGRADLPMAVVFPLEKSGQVALVVAPAVLSALSIVAVVLRVVARRMANRALDWSDYTIIGACVSERAPPLRSSPSPRQGPGAGGGGGLKGVRGKESDIC